MGGLLIVIVVLAIFFFLRNPDAATFAPLAALAGVGLLGAFDDYLNARTGEGIRARQKLVWLTVVGFVAAYQIQQTYDITAIAVPFVGAVAIDPRLYVLFAAFAIVATANGVNITDGLDGLSGGTVAIAFVAYMLIALLNTPNQANLALLCALIIGALLGFLWFNVHPAQIFIGDSGALSLGATLAVTALINAFLLVPALIYGLGAAMQIVIGTSVFQILFVTAFTTVLQAIQNNSVDLVLGAPLMLGGVIGAVYGAEMGQRLKAEYLRGLLGLLVVAVAVRMAAGLVLPPTEIYSIEQSQPRAMSAPPATGRGAVPAKRYKQDHLGLNYLASIGTFRLKRRILLDALRARFTFQDRSQALR